VSSCRSSRFSVDQQSDLSHCCVVSSISPPYAIHNGQHSSEGPLIDNLAKKSVSPEAISQGGHFYDLHNLDGTLATQHTFNALRENRPDERPFIVARSSYPGFGQYGHHWLGDNYSKWLYLQKVSWHPNLLRSLPISLLTDQSSSYRPPERTRSATIPALRCSNDRIRYLWFQW